MIGNAMARLESVKPRLAEVALGGTAVGTGLNAPPGFADRVIELVAEATGLPFVGAPNKFEAMAAKDACVETSRRAQDDRRRRSPRSPTTSAGWARDRAAASARLELPSLQPGSSIMPGKVNPVIPEAIADGRRAGRRQRRHGRPGRRLGVFELNVMMPVIAYNLLQSIQILAASATLLAERCVEGLTANRERAAEMVERSLAMVTSLAPRIGYDRAAEIAKQAFKTGRTVRELATEMGVLSPEELEEALDARAQTEGGVK